MLTAWFWDFFISILFLYIYFSLLLLSDFLEYLRILHKCPYRLCNQFTLIWYSFFIFHFRQTAKSFNLDDEVYVCVCVCMHITNVFVIHIRFSHSIFKSCDIKYTYLHVYTHSPPTHNVIADKHWLAKSGREKKKENSMYVALKCKSNETPHVFYSLLMSVFYNPRLMWCVNTFSFTILTNAHPYKFSSISNQFNIFFHLALFFFFFSFAFALLGFHFYWRFCPFLCHTDRQTNGRVRNFINFSNIKRSERAKL